MVFSFKIHSVLRVLDGDTVEVSVDLGFSTFRHIDVRLNGVDAPEIHSRDLNEKAAGGFVLEYVQRWLAMPGDYVLRSDVLDKEKYGRVLGDIIHGGDSLTAILLSKGMVRPYAGGKKLPWTKAELERIMGA